MNSVVWQYQQQTTISDQGELEKVLLANRGLTTSAVQETFFNPPAPSDFSLAETGIDQDQAARSLALLRSCLADHKKVLVFGDYDADGMCATTVMWETLYAFGLDVRPFIPDREKHGYGLSVVAVTDAVKAFQPDVIVTVDNGIVAHQAVETLKQQGYQVIITDHHATEKDAAGLAILPNADAVIHTTKACGAGVAYFITRWWQQNWAGAPELPTHLDVVGIATITDQMPLLAINRSLAVAGLAALQYPTRPGLQTLYEVAGVQAGTVNENTVNYSIGPRLNAMGRLGQGIDGVRLLCTQDVQRAKKLAADHGLTNQNRQELTEELYQQAKISAEQQLHQSLIIVTGAEYHEGVIGLIAGRLTEKYYRPAIVISTGKPVAKASARSIKEINVVELIRQVKADLVAVGGHPMAAGFSVAEANIQLVSDKLIAAAQQLVAADQLQPTLVVEAPLALPLLTVSTWEVVQRFAPFGQANPEPVFAIRDLVIADVQRLGSQKQHLKFSLAAAGDPYQAKPLTALAWNKAEAWAHLRPGMRVAVAGPLMLNEWQGRRTLQLQAKDIQVSSPE